MSFASEAWATLDGRDSAPIRFDPEGLSELPPPAQRFLRHALPRDTTLTTTVELAMVGEIRLGGRWMPFRADQILTAGVGFVWRATVGGRLLRFTGADALLDRDARMDFRLHGVVPVARASGTDTARSAWGRLAAETVVWAPQALTPETGVTWTAIDDSMATVAVDTPGGPIDVEVVVDADGRLERIGLERWNDSSEPPRHLPFGGPVGSEFVTATGVRIAGDGEVGWGRQGDRPDDPFFRYRVVSVE